MTMNTLYNAEQAYEEGMTLRGSESDSLNPEARAAFETAAEKSGIVLARKSESGDVDEALLLLGKSLFQLGRYADASATFRQYLSYFPDREETEIARLWLARSERRQGDYEAALAALAPIFDDTREDKEYAEILYERALIEIGRADYEAASLTYEKIIERFPSYAQRKEVTLQYADAQLAAGRYELALEGYVAYGDENVDPAVKRSVGLKVARGLVLAGRSEEAIATYDAILEDPLPDSQAAEVQLERADLLAAAERWDEAETGYARVAELAPGSTVASRAGLSRGRIVWQIRGDREQALDILLDAFLHYPTSAAADSARTDARGIERVLHYERLAFETEATGFDDPMLARSTAMYRLGEEILEVEKDANTAAQVFATLVEDYPNSPWRPRAMLAVGLLSRRNGAAAEANSRLLQLISEYPDLPESDSARRALAVTVPERPGDFHNQTVLLTTLVDALPDVEDPMVRIVDQLDRYADRRAAERAGAVRSTGVGAAGGAAPAAARGGDGRLIETDQDIPAIRAGEDAPRAGEWTGEPLAGEDRPGEQQPGEQP